MIAATRFDAGRAAALLSRAFLSHADAGRLDQIDMDLIREVVPLLDALCRLWFRQDVEGIADVPRGGALIVGNHNAGISFLELLGMGARWFLERRDAEPIYGLAHDGIVAVPGLGNFLVRCGGVRANMGNGVALLSRGEKVLVCPGGNLEAFRPYSKRHQVNLGGRKGFIRLALKARVPIVPVVFVGGQETFFVLHDGQFLARGLGLDKLLRVDTWPLTVCLPWGVALGPVFHLPLPAKCTTRFLPPISLDGYAPGDADDPAALEEICAAVTTALQGGMDEIAAKRRWPVIG